ncbi:hypothetical protein SAMN05216223_11860 [Actinacidiphila yanglinensis]|uniref:Uncharacterized protein n=1 Tax=Actinacidiphila yanglinensis TaxID=310779 RepID=A0A1H6DQ03_9ACTN|nr:hypothetical protein SAMN05216223_11860 [Actinacidiphila yanglinensis]
MPEPLPQSLFPPLSRRPGDPDATDPRVPESVGV